jgi:hypothetical protein
MHLPAEENHDTQNYFFKVEREQWFFDDSEIIYYHETDRS